MSNSPIYRLYIAEYEQCAAWMGGGGNAIVKYLKPYDMYLVYKTGRSKLPFDSYKRILDNMGEQCKFVDADQMSDNDLHAHMLAQIDYYANEHTHIYFLCDKEDYQAIRNQIKTGVEVSLKSNFRTGAIEIPPDIYPDFSQESAREISADADTVGVSRNKSEKSNLGSEDNKTTKPKNISQGQEEIQAHRAAPDGEVPEKPKEQCSSSNESRANTKEANHSPGKTNKENSKKNKENQNKQNSKIENNCNPETATQEQTINQSEEKQDPKKANKAQDGTAAGDPMSMFAAMFGGKIGDESQRAPGSTPLPDNKSKKQLKEDRDRKKAQAQEKWGAKKNSSNQNDHDESVSSADPNSGVDSLDVKEELSSSFDASVDVTNVNNNETHKNNAEKKTQKSTNKNNKDAEVTSENVQHSDGSNAQEDHKPWAERISGNKDKKDTEKSNASKLQDLERTIFGAKQSSVTLEKKYSPLDDSKALTVSLLADRLIERMENWIKGIEKYCFDYDTYMELISTLIRSDSLDDFKEGWSIVHPGCELNLDNKTYLLLHQEACYYAKTCEVLYADDNWS